MNKLQWGEQVFHIFAHKYFFLNCSCYIKTASLIGILCNGHRISYIYFARSAIVACFCLKLQSNKTWKM